MCEVCQAKELYSSRSQATDCSKVIEEVVSLYSKAIMPYLTLAFEMAGKDTHRDKGRGRLAHRLSTMGTALSPCLANDTD